MTVRTTYIVCMTIRLIMCAECRLQDGWMDWDNLVIDTSAKFDQYDFLKQQQQQIKLAASSQQPASVLYCRLEYSPRDISTVGAAADAGGPATPILKPDPVPNKVIL